MEENTRRLKSCVEAWPDCAEGEYNPYCCRFPKSCSCTIVHNQAALDDPEWREENLEPERKDFAEVVAEASANHPAVKIGEATEQLSVRQLIQYLLQLPTEALDLPVQVEGCDCSGPAIGINYDGTDTIIERGQEVYDDELDQMVLKPI